MPWEVALVCSVGSDQSNLSASRAGSHDRTLYVAYLSRLLGNEESPVHRGIVQEVLESDADLLTLSLSAVLEGAGPPYDHTHTRDGQPKAGSHAMQWEEQQTLKFLLEMCCGLESKDHLQRALTSCRNAGYVLYRRRYVDDFQWSLHNGPCVLNRAHLEGANF